MLGTTTEPVTPSPRDAELAATASSRLVGYIDRSDDIKLQLYAEGYIEALVLPGFIVTLLSQILKETASGHAVSVVPVDSEMTTFEAADYLNVSRPYLIGLLEQGKMPFRRVGTHRRIRLVDLAEYKKRQMEASYAAMAQLQAQAEELDMEN